MQTPKQQQKKPGTRTTGKPSDNDTDVNQQDHISSQMQNENLTDSEEDDETQMPDEQYPEENNITDEDEGNASPL